MAAVKALAELTKAPVPEQVNIAYGETRLTFGKDYIIPKPFDPGLFLKYHQRLQRQLWKVELPKCQLKIGINIGKSSCRRSGNDNKVVRLLHNRAKVQSKENCICRSRSFGCIKSGSDSYDEGIAIPILLGNKEVILELKKELEFDADVSLLIPKATNLMIQKKNTPLNIANQGREGVTFTERDIKCGSVIILQP